MKTTDYPKRDLTAGAWTISELIAALQSFRSEHGDTPVMFNDCDYGDLPIHALIIHDKFDRGFGEWWPTFVQLGQHA